jgi:hypothetical protein
MLIHFIICSRHVPGWGGLKEFNANLLRGVYEETGNVASSMLTTMLLLLN